MGRRPSHRDELTVTDTGPSDERVLETLDLLSKKWHPVIVQCLLRESPLRFNQLQDRIGDISGKVLTDSLDDMVENDIVQRDVVSDSPRRVEYSLTQRGRDLQSVMRELADWSNRNRPGKAPPMILIVDDDPRLTKMHANWLEDEYRVRRAHDGRTGLAMIDEDVDLVILDRRMPGLSGDEVLERIRNSARDPRVVMLTAVDADFDVVDMPFDDYLSKPVLEDELRDVVADVLSRKAYDETVLEYLSLVARRSILEGTKSSVELDGNEEYVRLRERIEDLEAELDQPVESATSNRCLRSLINK